LTERQLGSTTAPQGFYEYLPGGYPSAGAQWPLLMVLHGIGENGNGTTDLSNILSTGIPPLIGDDEWPGDRPFVVLMPQHPGGGCPGASEVQSMIAWAMANYDIAPKWVFLTGLSCGAIGSWGYLAEHLDEQIAAFVPVAGDGKGAFASKGCDLAKVAIWAFHGDDDGTVNVSGTNEPMDGLAACPKPPALDTDKTIYPGVGHNSWDQTYDLSSNHDIYAWFLAHPKP
jgi:predicted peptidase